MPRADRSSPPGPLRSVEITAASPSVRPTITRALPAPIATALDQSMSMILTRPASPTRSRPGWPRLALLVRAAALALLLVVGAEVARTAFGSNFHTVVRGRCYRCAQPSVEDLRQ